MKFGKTVSLMVISAGIVSMLSSIPVFASTELNFGTGFTPKSVTDSQEDFINVYPLGGYQQSPELFFIGDWKYPFNIVYENEEEFGDGGYQTFKTNKQGYVTEKYVNMGALPDGTQIGEYRTDYTYNKKGDVLTVSIYNRDSGSDWKWNGGVSTKFHYNKDYTLNYVEYGGFMIYVPTRDDSGRIIEITATNTMYDDNNHEYFYITYNPDGTIAKIFYTTYDDMAWGITYTFFYQNGRLASYQLDCPGDPLDTFVFDY